MPTKSDAGSNLLFIDDGKGVTIGAVPERVIDGPVNVPLNDIT